MLCVAQRGAAQSSAVAEHSDSARSDEAVAGGAVAGGAEPGRPAASDEERDGRDDVLGPDSSDEEELARVEADMAATRAARKRSLFVKSQDAQPPQPKRSKATRLTPAQMRLGDCTGMQWLKCVPWGGRGGRLRDCTACTARRNALGALGLYCVVNTFVWRVQRPMVRANASTWRSVNDTRGYEPTWPV